MYSIKMAEEMAQLFISKADGLRDTFGMTVPHFNEDFVDSSDDFKELVIQHIRIAGYKVERFNDVDGMCLILRKE